jgi:hypothetical protein
MEVIPASHQLDQIPHRDTFAKYNLLTAARKSRSMWTSQDASG